MTEQVCEICSGQVLEDNRAHRFLSLELANKDYKIYRCTVCKFRFMSPMAEPDDFQDYYSENYYTGPDSINSDFSKRKQDLEPYYTEIAQNFIKNNVTSMLDVGSGRGEFLSICAELGLNVEGLEPSSFGSDLSEKLGVKVTRGTLENILTAKRKFNGIHCSHVLEHVPNANQFINNIKNIMEPNALLYLEVPLQFDCIIDRIKITLGKQEKYSDYSIHHHYFFTYQSLLLLLKKHSFNIESATTFLASKRAARASSIRKLALQTTLFLSDKLFKGGDVISIWARRQ